MIINKRISNQKGADIFELPAKCNEKINYIFQGVIKFSLE